jgi:cell fate regulator YaaT (PSP1 superfamily)
LPRIVGVRFKRAGRVYYFDPGDLDLQVDDLAVVETARGTEAGRVIISPKQVLESDVPEPLKPVLRKVEAAELQQMDNLKKREPEAFRRCLDKICHHGLPMKLVGAEYNFDGSRLTFFFTAEGRVDFRELVRDLASTFHTRIELRQIGVRDEAKMLGGIGRCGRVLCCSSHMCDFTPVSIKMAKDQDLPLNPMKISGVCGRLLCCLNFENDFYVAAKQRMPRVNETVSTPAGIGRVIAISVIKQTVYVEMEGKDPIEVPAAEVQRAVAPQPAVSAEAQQPD